MNKTAICLWFDNQAEEAAEFYVSLLPDSGIGRTLRLPVDTPGAEAGKVLTVEFTLAGASYIALNGGPTFRFTPASSIFVNCDDQAEVDRLWDALLEGGEPQQCGWLTDRYGLSWQIVPKVLRELIDGADPERSRRVTEAMLAMVKLDSAALKAAYEG